MPPLNGFIGEITILQGALPDVAQGWAFWCVRGYRAGRGVPACGCSSAPCWARSQEKNRTLNDLSWREIAVFAPLIVWAFWIGLYPQPFFRVLERPVAQIVERVRPGYYAQQHLTNPLEQPSPTAVLRRP